MSKQIERLNDGTCRSTGMGLHHDGQGLYLAARQGAEGVTRSWLLRYTLAGKATWLGLGSYPTIGLAMARQKALEARRQLIDGIDPLQTKRAQRAALRRRGASTTATFRECSESYLRAHDAGWSRRHAQIWGAVPAGICLSGARGHAGGSDRHSGGAQGAAADLAGNADDGKPFT